jgi:hypothetical protein
MIDDEAFARITRKIIGDIDRVGRSVLGVFGADEDDAPPFSYTIGNALVGLPELLVIGLAGEGPLNHMSDLMIKNGRPFAEGELVDLGGPVPVKVITADERAKENYTIQVARFVGRSDYVVQQVIIPDRRGRFPGDPKCDQPYSLFPVLRRNLQ